MRRRNGPQTARAVTTHMIVCNMIYMFMFAGYLPRAAFRVGTW